MKKVLLLMALLLVGLCMAPTALAEEDWDPREDLPSIVDLVVADPDFDTLEAALTAAGIAGNIAEHGPFTVFAPTDEAFAKLPEGTLDGLLADNKMLTDVLLYHVLEGDIGPETAATLTEATMLNGEEVRIKIFEDDVYLNDDSKVIEADIIGMNGRVHAIDTVLLPPVIRTQMVREEMGDVDPVPGGDTIVDIAAADGRFDTLVTALTVTDLTFDLAASGEMTVFAPTDEAFANLPDGLLDDLLDDPTTLRKVLLYHVLSGDLSKEEAFVEREVETIEGETLFIKVFENEIYLNDVAKVIVPDILASNGRIHVINEVLIPPSMMPEPEAAPLVVSCDEETDYEDLTITEIVVADCRFTTLLAAVQAAGLADTLAGEGPFTVFAPTNEAFAKLPTGTLDALLADPDGALTDVLLYHVADGLLGSQEARSMTEKMMLNGDKVGIKVFENDIYLNDTSMIIIKDVVAKNGIIHVIDTVLIPPE
ncbi:MAG: fasciclin domain-containing protein [Ardenticatenaceae bacterium]|nr:fasciclin domain-containing protein [Ardenticatenaceae bacterium]